MIDNEYITVNLFFYFKHFTQEINFRIQNITEIIYYF